MMVTLWNYPKLYNMVFAEGSFSLLIMFKVFLLLVLFAAFFSALLLAVTSFARSFKEAQAYLIPIILLSMAPGLMAMMPGLTLAGPLAVVPMVNILLLARDVLHNDVMMLPALVTVVSTLAYTLFGVFVAAKIFGADAILYGSQGSWSDLLARPHRRLAIAPMMTVVFCMILLFPINFLFIGMLSRVESFGLRIFAMGVFCLLYTSPSPRDLSTSRMPSSA